MPDSSTRPRISKPLWAGIIGLIIVTIVLVAYSAKTLRDVAVLVEKETPTPNVPEIPQPRSPDFDDDGSEPDPDLTESSSFSNSTPSSGEIPFAEPVFGKPLMVRLPGENAKLGEISVEKYDADGNATGQPLEQGTSVQIPDPNNPGEKIHFRVP